MVIRGIEIRLPESGLHLLPRDWRKAFKAIAASIVGVTLFIVALDLLFWRTLQPSYVALFTSPLMPRMIVMCVLAALEELKYRLFLMTLLAVLLSRGTGRLSPVMWASIIILAQLANVGAAVFATPLYASLRYLAVGSVWGWLYWRHGWVSGLIGHAACHLLLDPLLLLALR
jgi:hypothetical protein